MLLSIIRLYPSPGNEYAVIDVLNSMKGPISASSDCIDVLVLAESSGEGGICYLERWRTREGLDRHLRSNLYSRVLEAMELSFSPPTVEFYEISSIGGMECIEQARLFQLR